MSFGGDKDSFTDFFRSEIELDIDKELLNYNRKRQKIILTAQTKTVVEAIEQAEFFKSVPPLKTEQQSILASEEKIVVNQLEEKACSSGPSEYAPSTSSLAEETCLEEANDTLDDLDRELNQQNNGAEEQSNLEGTQLKKLSSASMGAPEIDNIVVIRTRDNFLQVIDVSSKEKNFKLSVNNAKAMIGMLDQEFLPLIQKYENDSGFQEYEIIHQKRFSCGVTCLFELSLGYYQNQLFLEIAEIWPEKPRRTSHHTIAFTRKSVRLFRQKLAYKIKDSEPQKANFFTRLMSADEIFKVELLEEQDSIAVQHLSIKKVEERTTQCLVFSVPAAYKTVFYLQYFEKIISEANPTDAATHWAEEKDYRHNFTLGFIGNKLCLTITKEAIGQQEEVKSTLVIPSTLIGPFEKQLFQNIKNSGACMNCGKKGHRMNSCAKENNYIVSYSRVNFTGCFECGSLGHNRWYCPQLKENFELDTAQCSFTQTIDAVKTAQTGSSSKDSSNSSVQDENRPKSNRRTIPSESESNQSGVLSPGQQKVAEFKGREVLVEVVSDACGQQLIRVEQSSRFSISLKTEKGFVDILKDEFIPKYNSIEDKSAISSENQYICKRYLKEGNIEFELAFVLNRFNYMVQIVEVISTNGNYIEHTVVLSVMEMAQFIQKLKDGIEEAEALEQASTNLRKSFSNELDKDDAFFEPSTLDYNISHKQRKDKSFALTPVGQLQFFIKEFDDKHYIGISDSNTHKLHLSIPVAEKCNFYINEYYKFWKNSENIVTLSMGLNQWVKEDDCRYDLHYYPDPPEPFLRITEKYENPKTGEINQDSFSVAAHSLLPLRKKIFKKMDVSGACRQCGLITHASEHCKNRSVMEFSQICLERACYLCGASGHSSKDCTENSNPLSNRPEIGKHDRFAVSSKNYASPSTASAMSHSTVKDGLELKVIMLSATIGPVFLVDIQQVTDKEARIVMSIAVARNCVKRLETTFIPFCKKMDLKEIAGLTKELIKQSIEANDTCRFNLVLVNENARFFLRIVESHSNEKSNIEIERRVTIPAECMEDFCAKMQEKINEADKQSINSLTFLSFASAQEVERSKINDFDDRNELTLYWKDDRCYVLISTIRAIKSKIRLPLADLKEFVIMLKTHQQYYESLSDKQAKLVQIKILKETQFDGKESQIKLLFGINFIGYFLRIVECYFSPIVEGKVERTVVVSGHAIKNFIVQIENVEQESNACFRCSKAGHRSSACDQQIFLHKHCYKCGSIAHFHRNCDDDQTCFFRRD